MRNSAQMLEAEQWLKQKRIYKSLWTGKGSPNKSIKERAKSKIHETGKVQCNKEVVKTRLANKTQGLAGTLERRMRMAGYR